MNLFASISLNGRLAIARGDGKHFNTHNQATELRASASHGWKQQLRQSNSEAHLLESRT
jgi:hypothetical protein